MVLFVSCGILWGATSLDEAINELLEIGSFVQDGGTNVFIGNVYFTGDYPPEKDAYWFVAWSAILFLVIREDWESISNSTVDNNITQLDKISCPFHNGYASFLVSIPFWEIREHFSSRNPETIDFEELFNEIQSYVNYYGDIRNLSME